MAGIRLDTVVKRFGGISAVDGVSLEVAQSRVTALLGPSGCGKTTLLRLIAGLETVTQGQVLIGGRDVTQDAPERRNVGMMFQSYALFPHMTVAENLRFPLRMRGRRDLADQARRVAAALDLVRLPDVGDRLPRQLSGGQQQRVAFARALIAEPDVLLLDEPLSNLDARLRDEMQLELVEMRRRVPITTVIVTHDQSEALALADEIVLMRQGRIEQIGTPAEVWAAPATAFAADFLGGANLIPVEVRADCEGWRAVLTDGVAIGAPPPPGAKPGRYVLMVRPEAVRVGAGPSTVVGGLTATVAATAFQGTVQRLSLVLPGGGRVRAETPADEAPLAGATVTLTWPTAACRLYPAD